MINPVEKVKKAIQEALEKALAILREEGKISFNTIPSYVVEVPREKVHGDFATNLAMVMAREARMVPRQIASLVQEAIGEKNLLALPWEKIEVAGPGFINFYLKPQWLYDVLVTVLEEGRNYGRCSLGQGQKVQVEFVSANPTGLLHMGNARGAALGDTLASILEWTGHEVTREFYINDAGNQIENFGLSLEARYLQALGQDVPFPEEGYHGQDIIDTVHRLIQEVGDSYLQLPPAERREKLVEYALKEKLQAIRDSLSRFGVEYDVWFSERTLHETGKVAEVVKLLSEKGYTYEKDGAVWFKATEFGDEKDEVLVRANGIPTYFAADIAYHKNKFDRGFERVINIWGADHHGHVRRMKGAMAALGYNPEALDIIIMQLVRLFQGGEILRMSKRTGQYVTLDELVEEVGRDAARYFFIMRSADSHLDFDLDLAKKQSNENPVYYIQYAHARICSIFRQLAERGGKQEVLKGEALRNLLAEGVLQEEAELDLLRHLAFFPEELLLAARELAPHRIARYTLELAGLFHSFYNAHRVIGVEEKLQAARLALVRGVQVVLQNALAIMGITAPERM